MLLSVGISVQVTVVWLVVVGQLPQFDARMLYWTAGQAGEYEFQVKALVILNCEKDVTQLILSGGERLNSNIDRYRYYYIMHACISIII